MAGYRTVCTVQYVLRDPVNQVQGCPVDAVLDHQPHPVEAIIAQSANPVILQNAVIDHVSDS